jgi:hypothetical protein
MGYCSMTQEPSSRTTQTACALPPSLPRATELMTQEFIGIQNMHTKLTIDILLTSCMYCMYVTPSVTV